MPKEMPKTIVILLVCAVGLLAAIPVTILVLAITLKREPVAPVPPPPQTIEEKLTDFVNSNKTELADIYEKSKIKAARTQLSAFEQAIDIFQLDLRTYPTTEQGIASLRTAPPDLSDKEKWQGPYLKKEIPLDPWGNPYGYKLLGPQQYEVRSLGPDGTPGTADDIAVTSG